MSSSSRRPLLALTAATGGLLAALSSAAVAGADYWAIEPYGSPAPETISVSGTPPFDQSILEQGYFSVEDIHPDIHTTDVYEVQGTMSSTENFGMTNLDLVSNNAPDDAYFPAHSVVDILSFGQFSNDYVDMYGVGPGGTNLITDTLATPFGDFNIPTTFDAAALGSTPFAAAAAESAAALPAAAATTAYSILPDPGDGDSTVTAVGGLAPLYTTIDYGGTFVVQSSQYDGVVEGNAEYYSNIFGMHNVLMQVLADNSGIPHGIIDDLSFSSGWENVYTDFVDSAGVAPNTITDTLITPFGDFNIPVAYDAVADFPTPLPGAAADLFGTLSADWTTLVTDFSALF